MFYTCIYVYLHSFPTHLTCLVMKPVYAAFFCFRKHNFPNLMNLYFIYLSIKKKLYTIYFIKSERSESTPSQTKINN